LANFPLGGFRESGFQKTLFEGRQVFVRLALRNAGVDCAPFLYNGRAKVGDAIGDVNLAIA